MANRRPVYIGSLVYLALALLLQPISVRATHPSPHSHPGVSFSARISWAKVTLQRRTAREHIIVVVIVSGRELTPRKKFMLQNNVIIKVNGRSQTATLNTRDSLESENDTTLTVQTDESGALSTDILVDMNGPAERAGAINTINETVNVSDSMGQQLAITGTLASVTSQ